MESPPGPTARRIAQGVSINSKAELLDNPRLPGSSELSILTLYDELDLSDLPIYIPYATMSGPEAQLTYEKPGLEHIDTAALEADLPKLQHEEYEFDAAFEKRLVRKVSHLDSRRPLHHGIVMGPLMVGA
ncbi:hypothetical protein M231_07926 [Tremella mesenterica]|uniref:Uncharacterized protein n=1 Tax=Tremella mesenterica TaxID=5217 RepID=A0A4Q1BDF1_TREME|nr:hypothetical protein M231_07926 [Tremella mesenterica]